MTPSETIAHAPAVVRLANPLMRRLLAVGLRFGPNTLLTVRGRRSGRQLTLPVAIAEIGERRFVISAYGEVNWTRNLRAAREAVVRLGGRDVEARATELDEPAAVAFYRDLLPAYVRTQSLLVRIVVTVLFRTAAPEIFDDPARAARTRPVFELGPK